MKRIVTAFCLCMGIIFSANLAEANSGSGVYVSPRFAITVHDQSQVQIGRDDILSNGSGIGFGISGGLAIGLDRQYAASYMPIRIEAEALFRTRSKSKESLKINNVLQEYQQELGIETYFLNLYYDFHSAGSFVPYLQGGIGYVRLKNKFVQGSEFKEDNTHTIGYNLGLGVSWLVQAGFGLDVGYRYTIGGESTMAYTSNLDNRRYVSNAKGRMHELMLGARFTF